MQKMPQRNATTKGTVVYLEHHSKVLSDNPLGDPSERQLPVYLPPGFNRGGRSRGRPAKTPVLFDLAGFTGSGLAHLNWKNFEENLIEKLDRLIGAGKMPPVIAAFPDCFTKLGGNQYINSSAIGRYADYLTLELIPFLDEAFSLTTDRTRRGCFGKSSGGYGALVHGMQYTDYWAGVACHSGDAYFDFVYRSEWPSTLTHLQQYASAKHTSGRYKTTQAKTSGHDDGRVRAFLAHLEKMPPWSEQHYSGRDITTLMMLAMAASYDPDPDAPNGFCLPFDLETGAFLADRWRRWLRHDPINMVPRYKKSLARLKAIFIDCGWNDQYHIHFGARQLAAVLQDNGIAHRYEEFPGTHSGIDYRFDVSLPYLAKRLAR